MAIQMRRGAYANYDPSKLVPGEVAVVQSDDPNATDGKSVYIAFAAGNVKRLATYDDMVANIESATSEIADDLVAQIEADVADELEAAQQAASDAEDYKDAAAASAEDAEQTLATTPKTYGNYPDMAVGTSEQLDSDIYTEDRVPYVSRNTGGVSVGSRAYETIVGGTIAWNQLVNTTDTSVTVPSGHKYYSNINGVKTISASTGTAISINDATEDNVHDLTQMFGTTIADYVYGLETATAGSGIAKLKSWGFFTEDYYAYDAGSLQSVQTSVHVTRDADENVIGNYPLDSDLVLRGIARLDSDNNLYYDGDTYKSDGTVTRKYGLVDLGTLDWAMGSGVPTGVNMFRADVANRKYANYQTIANGICQKYLFSGNYGSASIKNNLQNMQFAYQSTNTYVWFRNDAYNDADDFKSSLSGVYLLYVFNTISTETADMFTSPQIIDPDGTEEYVDAGVNATTPTRDVSIPVGHITRYPKDQKKKLDGLPDNFSTLIATTEPTSTASKNYAVGDYLILDNQLYKVTSAITSGGTIASGTNVTAITLDAVLTKLPVPTGTNGKYDVQETDGKLSLVSVSDGIDTTLAVSGKSADAKITGNKISDVKSNLDDTQNMMVIDASDIDIGNLVDGTTVSPATGINSNSTSATRTGYVDFNYPVLIKFTFDLSVYNYDVWTYTGHAVQNKVDNPTNGDWCAKDRIIVFPPSTGSAKCFRIGIKRVDETALTKDTSDPTSDFYKIKNGISIYKTIPKPPTSNGTYVLKCTVSSGITTYSWVAE